MVWCIPWCRTDGRPLGIPNFLYGCAYGVTGLVVYIRYSMAWVSTPDSLQDTKNKTDYVIILWRQKKKKTNQVDTVRAGENSPEESGQEG